ncbi:hypothetical protein [Dyella choica]|uniref:Uncharacterized protein n=1 Tax=Dyella choica TaxID=1927959 RepID=A0A432M7M6_9GAMM|nr:hypothetical protein [Dyella choica]RUL77514.1 hypothetical protein EKH80_06385 [Dyella choica]
MDQYQFTVSAGELIHVRTYSTEELSFLTGHGAPEITAFRVAIGLWDNFSVARGMDENAQTVKSREMLLAATSELLHRLEQERELFSHSYKLKCPDSRSRGSMKCWIELKSGETGFLMARHAGQLYFEHKEAGPKIIDMRALSSLDTATGETRIFRKRNELRWPLFLQDLEVFLKSLMVSEVSISHGKLRRQMLVTTVAARLPAPTVQQADADDWDST